MRNLLAPLSGLAFALALGTATLLSPGAARADMPILSVAGPLDLGDPDVFTLADLRALESHTITTSTPWDGDEQPTFKGPLLRDVLALANEAGHTVNLTARDGYQASLPFSDAEDWDVIVALEMDGELLDPTTYGPARIIYPYDTDPILITETYQSRSLWQLVRMDVK